MSNKFYFHTPEAKERFLDVMRERAKGEGLGRMAAGRLEEIDCAIAAVTGYVPGHYRLVNTENFRVEIGNSGFVWTENDDFVGTPQERAYHMYLWGSKQPVRGEESS